MTDPAAVQLLRIVRAHPGQCTIVATGPLTNLALALLLDPEVAALVSDVVVMGGTVEHPGNITPYAEANVALDPEAARLVFGAPWRVTQVGLDVTMATWLEEEDLARIERSDTAAGRFAWQVLQHYLDFYSGHSDPGHRQRRGCPVHDPCAAVVAVDPSLASWREAPYRRRAQVRAEPGDVARGSTGLRRQRAIATPASRTNRDALRAGPAHHHVPRRPPGIGLGVHGESWVRRASVCSVDFPRLGNMCRKGPEPEPHWNAQFIVKQALTREDERLWGRCEK
ncbi:MAG: nucleoside hydrolase [Acidimicrobiales bacterium]|nr:nucleoside hydrolase [Acidimicrobiales bacterium]